MFIITLKKTMITLLMAFSKIIFVMMMSIIVGDSCNGGA